MSAFSHYALYSQEPPEHGGGLIYQTQADYTPAGREALQEQADRMHPRGLVLPIAAPQQQGATP